MDPRHLEHGHHPRDIAKRLRDGPRISYLRDWVYGGIDGTVTTFAVVAGVVGAELSTKALLILGAANLFADGFSMAAANYSGTKAEIEEYEQVRRMEERHVDITPEGEREEIRQIFQAKGFEGEALDSAVDVITGKRERWIDTMMTEEHGLPPISRSPGKAWVSAGRPMTMRQSVGLRINPGSAGGSAKLSSMLVTWAAGGPRRQALSTACSASCSPASRASTVPSLRLRTQPEMPLLRASRISQSR